jgi:hypothetical protein
MAALTPEECAILDLECDVVAGHMVKVVGIAPADRPLGAAAIRARIAERLAATPLLCRRLVPGGAEPAWEDVADVDLDAHVVGVELGPGRTLTEAVADLFAGRLDRSRPLWDVHVVDAGDEHEWIVWRLHHALADGSAAMRILDSALWDPHGPPAAAPAPAHPAGAAARAHLVPALRHELRPALRRSPFDGRLTGAREVAFAVTHLHALHDGARAAVPGATLNDALLTAVGGGLRRWMEARHDHLGSVRVKVPVSLHSPGDDLGNRDSFFAVDVPIHERDPVLRLRAVQSQTAARKRQHDAEAVDTVLHELHTASPRLARFAEHAMGHPRAFALNLSNVPGPRDAPAVGGAPVVALHTLAEVGQRHALRIAAVSLCDVLSVGICADPTLVGGLEPLVAGFEEDAAALSAVR